MEKSGEKRRHRTREEFGLQLHFFFSRTFSVGSASNARNKHKVVMGESKSIQPPVTDRQITTRKFKS